MAVIGGVRIQSSTRAATVSQKFEPKLEVSIGEVSGFSTVGVQDGYTLVYNSDNGQFEPKAVAELTTEITELSGGTF